MALAMNEPLYLTIARKDLGLKEMPGAMNEPRILDAFAAIGHSWLNNDEQPWCAAMLGHWLIKAKLPFPKNAFRALSWLTYGAGYVHPMYGAIAVMTRQGGGHVGIVTGVTKDKKYVRVLGGNQQNMVCESFFPATRISSYRAPIGVSLVEPPVCELGELSKTEK